MIRSSALYGTWGDTSVTVQVPTGATTGNIIVTVSSTASNGVPFTVGDNIYYFFSDQIGSTRVMANSSGTVCFDADYAPYGQQMNVYTSACPTSYQFAGKERDPESGNDFSLARYFASNQGRFTSPDPSGIFLGDLSDPQQLNLYSYARNNPINLVDSTGLDLGYDLAKAGWNPSCKAQ